MFKSPVFNEEREYLDWLKNTPEYNGAQWMLWDERRVDRLSRVPTHYPCIAVLVLTENNYGQTDWHEEFVYSTDFQPNLPPTPPENHMCRVRAPDDNYPA